MGNIDDEWLKCRPRKRWEYAVAKGVRVGNAMIKYYVTNIQNEGQDGESQGSRRAVRHKGEGEDLSRHTEFSLIIPITL